MLDLPFSREGLLHELDIVTAGRGQGRRVQITHDPCHRLTLPKSINAEVK